MSLEIVAIVAVSQERRQTDLEIGELPRLDPFDDVERSRYDEPDRRKRRPSGESSAA
jgi:hypothetical protein